MGYSIIRAVVLLAAALSANTAHAICRGQPPARVYVGASAATCDYTSIQSAINAASSSSGCGTVINIAPDTNWINQSLQISGDKLLSLVGWGSGETCSHLKSCTATGCSLNQSPRLPIKPASGQSGLYVSGASNNISISNIEFTGGSLDSGHGGAGIAFNGSGSLSLDTVTIDNNTAGFGGGIWFNGSGSLNISNAIIDSNTANPNEGGGLNVSTTGSDPITVTLGANVIVAHNTTQMNGGGIFIQGNTHLVAEAPNIWIYANSALNGAGGGVFVGGAALADIGSPGYATLPVIDQNQAEYGGGIGLDRSSSSTTLRPMVNLYTTDPNNPVSVSGNLATHTGGGIYLKPTGYGYPYLCAYDFRIDDNSAQEGTGIYADYSGGFSSAVNLNTYNDSIGNSMCSPPANRVACAAGVACNEINGNVAETGNGTPTSGAAILMQSNGGFRGGRFVMRGNTGGKALRFLSDADGAYAELRNCLIADNSVTEQAIEMTPGGGNYITFIIDNCTIANNTIGANHAIVAQMGSTASSFTLTNSIIDQPGLPTLDYSGPSGTSETINYVVSNDVSTLSGIGVGQGTPTFVNAAGGDYHLQPLSLGVDYAPAGSTSVDLDGNPRVVDLNAVANVFGPMDLGAYELQTASACLASDTIFCNGFEN